MIEEKGGRVEQGGGVAKVDEEVVNHLNVVSNELTSQEKEYIKKKRNDYLDDLRPFINVVQMQQQQAKQ